MLFFIFSERGLSHFSSPQRTVLEATSIETNRLFTRKLVLLRTFECVTGWSFWLTVPAVRGRPVTKFHQLLLFERVHRTLPFSPTVQLLRDAMPWPGRVHLPSLFIHIT